MSCDRPEEPRKDNPLDPESPDYTRPRVGSIKSSISRADVEFEWKAALTFQWEASKPLLEYRYQLVTNDKDWSAWCKANNPSAQYSYNLNNAEWSGWTTNNSYKFYSLDEGEYTFLVKTRYIGHENLKSEEPGYLSPGEYQMVTVDAVKGPALMIRPRSVIVKQGTRFKVQIMAEEVTDLMAAYLVLNYNNSSLKLEGVENGDFLSKYNNGQIIFLMNPVNEGKIGINTGVVAGYPASADGSGVMAEAAFIALKTGNSSLSFEQAMFRTPDNTPINIKELVSGTVQVNE